MPALAVRGGVEAAYRAAVVDNRDDRGAFEALGALGLGVFAGYLFVAGINSFARAHNADGRMLQRQLAFLFHEGGAQALVAGEAQPAGGPLDVDAAAVELAGLEGRVEA